MSRSLEERLVWAFAAMAFGRLIGLVACMIYDALENSRRKKRLKEWTQ